MPRSVHEASAKGRRGSYPQSSPPNERELRAEQGQSATINPDSLATDANGLEIAAQQLEEECKVFHAKSKSSVTTQITESSGARETQRLKRLADQKLRLQDRAVRLYGAAIGIYRDDYDRVARCYVQRVRYFQYGIRVYRDEGLSETLYDIPAIRKDHFEADTKRRVAVAKYRLSYLLFLGVELENRRSALRKDRKKPNPLEDRAVLANGYNRSAINAAAQALGDFEDSVREVKFLAERLRFEAGEHVISSEDVYWLRKAYRSVVEVFIEAGLPLEHPGEYKPFEEAYYRSTCALM